MNYINKLTCKVTPEYNSHDNKLINKHRTDTVQLYQQPQTNTNAFTTNQTAYTQPHINNKPNNLYTSYNPLLKPSEYHFNKIINPYTKSLRFNVIKM